MASGPPGSKFLGDKKDRHSSGCFQTIRDWFGVKIGFVNRRPGNEIKPLGDTPDNQCSEAGGATVISGPRRRRRAGDPGIC